MKHQLFWLFYIEIIFFILKTDAAYIEGISNTDKSYTDDDDDDGVDGNDGVDSTVSEIDTYRNVDEELKSTTLSTPNINKEDKNNLLQDSDLEETKGEEDFEDSVSSTTEKAESEMFPSEKPSDVTANSQVEETENSQTSVFKPLDSTSQETASKASTGSNMVSAQRNDAMNVITTTVEPALVPSKLKVLPSIVSSEDSNEEGEEEFIENSLQPQESQVIVNSRAKDTKNTKYFDNENEEENGENGKNDPNSLQYNAERQNAEPFQERSDADYDETNKLNGNIDPNEEYKIQEEEILKNSPPYEPQRNLDYYIKVGPDEIPYLPEQCLLPPHRGAGHVLVHAWYFDSSKGSCRHMKFRAGPSPGGNANRFPSRPACEAFCIRKIRDSCRSKIYFDCPRNSECVTEGDINCENQYTSRREQLEKCPPPKAVCRFYRSSITELPSAKYNPPEECLQPVHKGTCRQVSKPITQFYYNKESNECKSFYFFPCGGNDNRFNTVEECMDYCAH